MSSILAPLKRQVVFRNGNFLEIWSCNNILFSLLTNRNIFKEFEIFVLLTSPCSLQITSPNIFKHSKKISLHLLFKSAPLWFRATFPKAPSQVSLGTLVVCWFPRASGTEHRTLGGLKQQKCINSRSWGAKVPDQAPLGPQVNSFLPPPASGGGSGIPWISAASLPALCPSSGDLLPVCLSSHGMSSSYTDTSHTGLQLTRSTSS